MRVTDVDCLNKALKLRQFIRACDTKHPISKIQAFLTTNNTNDGSIKQEYSKVTNDEQICHSAQIAINSIIDYNRIRYNNDLLLSLGDSNIIDEVSSINLNSYLERKSRPFHVCIQKSLSVVGVETIGDLIREYETEQDINLSKAMKIIISTIPNNLIEIANDRNEYTSNDENLRFLNVGNNERKKIQIITTKEFQVILKIVLGKVESANFEEKLSVTDFKSESIIAFRKNCKNVRLRNTFFRLIHNDFFTYAKMKKYKMVENDNCIRCGQVENTVHLLWECSHASNIWNMYNSLMKLIKKTESINQYSDIFNFGESACTDIIKIKIINKMIQKDRPRNWSIDNFKSKIGEIIRIEKYNACKNRNIGRFNSKWHEIEKQLFLLK